MCPCCNSTRIRPYTRRQAFDYFSCPRCGAIFIDPRLIEEIDAGKSLVTYDETYWANELPAARERAYGPCLARAAEVIYYCRVPIHRFLDIGTGPGYFLDAIERYLPGSPIFYGSEKFPPPNEHRSRSSRYIVGNLGDVANRFEAGMCMEVLEHLTPAMVQALFSELLAVSIPGSLFLFNSGLAEYVRNEDPAYLDPASRGHIVSYTVEALTELLRGIPFTIRSIRGKSWAFCAERQPVEDPKEDITQRVWSPLPENIRILEDAAMGSVLKILGRESIRAYLSDVSMVPDARIGRRSRQIR